MSEAPPKRIWLQYYDSDGDVSEETTHTLDVSVLDTDVGYVRKDLYDKQTEAIREAVATLKAIRWRAVLDGLESPDELASWITRAGIELEGQSDTTTKELPNACHSCGSHNLEYTADAERSSRMVCNACDTGIELDETNE